MRARIVSLIFCLLAACLVPFAVASNATSADAAPTADVVTCTSIRIDTNHIEIKCTAAGIIVLDTTVSLPPGATVTLPPLPAQTVTVHVPGPTVTATVRVPVPGPTQSVTVSGPTSTVTANGPTSTATVQNTVTETATVSTGQVDNDDDTLDPSPSVDSDPVISIPAPTTIKGAALGTLAILVLCAIILAALFGGYTLGYKEADVANATFMKRIMKKE